MAVYNGKNGGFTFADGSSYLSANTNSWEISTTSDVADSTDMGATWETRVAGLTDFTATTEVNAQLAADYTSVVGASAVIDCSVDESGPSISGTGICTSITETVSIDDIGKVSATFEGNDATGLVLAATGGSTGSTSGTKFHGKSAAATFDATDFGNIVNWSYTLNAGTADSTGMHATNAGRTRTSGFKSGTATVSTYQDATQNAKISESATLILKRSAAVSALSVTAICTGISNGMDKAGNATVDYTFEFTGAATKPA